MSTIAGPSPAGEERRHLPVAPSTTDSAIAAHEAIAQRALADLARPQGGSLVVFRDPALQRYWPHMPEPVVCASSVAEAHALWSTRDFVGVLIGCDTPEDGVTGLAERVTGVASCVRYVQDSVEGVPLSAEGEHVWPQPHRCRSVRIEANGLIRVDLGNGYRSSMYHERMAGFVHRVSHLCYLERRRCKSAPDLLLRRSASIAAWPPRSNGPTVHGPVSERPPA